MECPGSVGGLVAVSLLLVAAVLVPSGAAGSGHAAGYVGPGNHFFDRPANQSNAGVVATDTIFDSDVPIRACSARAGAVSCDAAIITTDWTCGFLIVPVDPADDGILVEVGALHGSKVCGATVGTLQIEWG